MHVVYQRPIWDRILDARSVALREMRVIEKIVLTKDEAKELKQYVNSTTRFGCVEVPDKILGIKIEVENDSP